MSSKKRYVFDTNVIVSGDDDLLALGSFRDIPILTPAQFIASLKE